MQPPQRQDLILSGPNATMNGRPSDDHKNHSSGRKWRSRGRKPFQVVHLSDVHVDRQYVVRMAAALYTRFRVCMLMSGLAARIKHYLFKSHLL